MKINIKVDSLECLPYKKHNSDAGFDLKSNMNLFDIYPNETCRINTGVYMEIPYGYVGLVFPRSGLGSVGFALKNTIGVIDSDYRGEIIVVGINRGTNPIAINKFDRIAQILIVPILLPTLNIVDTLNETERGEGGFGHTGLN